MSTRTFKDIQKAKDVVVLYFGTPASQWDETMSVTMAAADAQRLLRELERTLHPASKSAH